MTNLRKEKDEIDRSRKETAAEKHRLDMIDKVRERMTELHPLRSHDNPCYYQWHQWLVLEVKYPFGILLVAWRYRVQKFMQAEKYLYNFEYQVRVPTAAGKIGSGYATTVSECEQRISELILEYDD